MKEKLTILKVIHLASCVTLIIAYVIVGDLLSLDSFKWPNIDSFSLIYLGIAIVPLILGHFMFNLQLKKMDPNRSLEERFPIYMSASIIRWAFIEGAAFFVLFFMPDFLIIGILLMIYLVFLNPTEDKLKRDLNAFGLKP